MDESPPRQEIGPGETDDADRQLVEHFMDEVTAYLEGEKSGTRKTAHLKKAPGFPELNLEELRQRKDAPETRHAAELMKKIHEGTITRQDLKQYQGVVADQTGKPREGIHPLFSTILLPFLIGEGVSVINRREFEERKQKRMRSQE